MRWMKITLLGYMFYFIEKKQIVFENLEVLKTFKLPFKKQNWSDFLD